jgi:multidrug resistance protein MdtO
MRVAIMATLVVAISETFRIPLPAYSAYIVFFASREEVTSTVLTAVVLTIAASIAVATTLAGYMVTADEPALRLPMMAVITFGGLFFSRVSPLGPAAFAAGFVASVALTLIDVIPNAEALTEMVLWLWVVAMLPIGTVVVVNLLIGKDPADLFRDALVRRLTLAGHRLCGDGDAGEGLAGLIGILPRLLGLSRLAHPRSPRQRAASEALVARVHEISTLVVEWSALADGRPVLPAVAGRCGGTLLAFARCVAAKRVEPLLPLPDLDDRAWREDPKASLLLARLMDILAMLPALLEERLAADRPGSGEPAPRKQILVADAFTNPDHVRFALKVTLASILAYVSYNMVAWPGIRTAMITCFFVTVGSLGETSHRMLLRLTGAVIGGGLGLLTIIFVMPRLTSIGDLCVVIALLSFFAAWITNGSERLSYAGMQIAMAFFFCVLVGYGPTIDLSEARDRLVGVLLGNGIVWLVFSQLWPVSAARQARLSLAGAVRRLADVLRLTDATTGRLPGQSDQAVFAFDGALAQASRFATFDLFEPMRVREDGPGATDVGHVQALLGPTLLLGTAEAGHAAIDAASAEATAGYRDALAGWLEGLAEWLSGTADSGRVLPPPSADGVIQQLALRDGKTAGAVGALRARMAWLQALASRADRLRQSVADDQAPSLRDV